jgi:uncharacterized protein (TIGR02444 family)
MTVSRIRGPERGGGAAQIGEAFWRFSLMLYARPGVAAASIALQDRAGLDINLILFALWAGAVQGVRLDRGALAATEVAIEGLRSAIVEPMRALRRHLKPVPADDVQALRRKVLALELGAERRVQQRLAECLNPSAERVEPGARLATAEANLALYLAAEAQSPEAGLLRRALAALIRRG